MSASPLRRAALLAATALLPAGGALAQGMAAWPLYGSGSSSLLVPFQNAATFLDRSTTASPSIALSFPGFVPGRPAFTMDTGSTGIVASPDNFQPGPDATVIGTPGAGIVTYSSSGRQNHGTWYLTSVNILGAPDAQQNRPVIAVAQVPVLQVTSISCLATARDCTPNSNPTGVAMMGVGFGREPDLQPQGTPDKNPLLHITQIAQNGALVPVGAAWNQGYAVGSAGVTVGLTAANTAGATFAKLLPLAGYAGEWGQAPAAITVQTPGAPAVSGVGNALMDTGVPTMFLRPLAGSALQTNQPVPDGTVIAVNLGAAGFAGYSFVAGDTSNPLAPSGINVPNGGTPFVNTSRFLLNGVEVIYDQANGYVGYRLAPGAAGTNAFVAAGVALQGNVSLAAGFASSLPVALIGDTAIASAGSVTLSGGIAGGAQALTLGGGGAFFLSGAGTYAGGTTVTGNSTLQIAAGNEIGSGPLTLAGGALAAGGSFALANAVVLGSGGSGLFLNGQAIRLDGALSGASTLQVTGPGTATLTNTANAHTGGTLVQNGAVLAVSADAQLGAATGALFLSGGTLRALASFSSSRPVLISSQGATFDTGAGNVLTLGGTFSQGGPVMVLGTGEVIHGGTVLAAAPVTAASGTLTVNGTLSGAAVNVAAGATLGGSGLVAATTSVSGTLSPGNSPGTLTFAAPVTMQPGSRLLLDIQGPAGNDLVYAAGPQGSFAAGGTLAPRLGAGFAPALGQRFAVVQADAGVTGGFSGLTQPATGLAAGTRFDALYAPNAVSLVVTPAAYGNLAAAGLAQTGNQAGVGAALDALRPAAGTRPADAVGQGFANLHATAPNRLGVSLDSLAGTPWGDALSSRLEAGRGFSSAMADQLAAARGSASVQGQQARSGRHTAWVRGTGQPMLRQGSDGSAPGFTAGGAGVAAGFETQAAPSLRLGAAVGHATTTASPRLGGGDRAETESLLFGVYGGWTGPRGLFLDGDLSGGWARDRVRRDLGALGAGAPARASAEGTSFSAGARGGVVRDLRGWTFEPAVGFRYARAERGAASEQAGGNPFALAVTPGALESARATLGVTLRRETQLAGLPLTPSLRLGYGRELADARAVTVAGFQALPASTFRAVGAAPGRDAALLGAGVSARVAAGLSVFVDYAADLRSNHAAQTVSGGLRWSF